MLEQLANSHLSSKLRESSHLSAVSSLQQVLLATSDQLLVTSHFDCLLKQLARLEDYVDTCHHKCYSDEMTSSSRQVHMIVQTTL